MTEDILIIIRFFFFLVLVGGIFYLLERVVKKILGKKFKLYDDTLEK